MATSQLQALLDSFEARLSTVEQAVGTGMGTTSVTSRAVAPGDGGDLPASVMAFDEYNAKCLEPFVAACEKLGGGAAAGVSLLWVIDYVCYSVHQPALVCSACFTCHIRHLRHIADVVR